MKINKLIFAAALLGLYPFGLWAGDLDINVTFAIGKEVKPAVERESRNGPPSWAPAHGRRAKAVYFYYPEHQVYRNAGDGTWIYYNGGTWTVGTRLPSRIQIGDWSGFVALEMNTDKPQRFHSEVVNVYPGNGYVEIGNAKKQSLGKAGWTPPGQGKKGKKGR